MDSNPHSKYSCAKIGYNFAFDLDCDFKEGQGGWDDWSERKDSLTGKISYEPSGAFYTDYR